MATVKTPLKEEAGRVQDFGPGDVVGPENGGTGLDAVGSAGQMLVSDGAALSWGMPPGLNLYAFYAFRGL